MSRDGVFTRRDPMDIYELVLEEWNEREQQARQEGDFAAAFQAEQAFRSMVAPMLMFVNKTARREIALELLEAFNPLSPDHLRFGTIPHLVKSHVDLRNLMQHPDSAAYHIYQGLLKYARGLTEAA